MASPIVKETQEQAWSSAAQLLATFKPRNVLFPTDPAYHRARYGLWSRQQSELLPLCIFQPESAADVALAVTTANNLSCPFAVKSGGHASFAGASSTRGILIDLAKMNRVTLSEDKSAVHVGPGNRWVDVYTALEPLGLTVIGGRDADVGVGGLVLGGGISFFSSVHGWACDNVDAFEVVLANGQVVTATSAQYSDLYKALRGGGPNFGIVTDFKLRAYPYRGMWGGLRVHEYKETDRMLSAFINYGIENEKDPKVSFILNFGRRQGKWYYANDQHYCEPIANAEGFKEFLDIPAVDDSSQIKHMAHQTVDMASRTPRNFRNSYWVLTTKMRFDVLKYYVETFVEECEKLLKEVANFHPAFDVQVITTGMLKNMRKNGGNVLGLSPSEEPLLLYNPVPRWSDPADDEKVYKGMQNVITKTKQRARELGLENDYLYMNYASQFQDVFNSYGKDNVRFLQNVSRKYDPQQVFLRSQNFFTFSGTTLPKL